MKLENLGIKTYEDYKRNEQTIFDLVCEMLEEFADKHPDFIKQQIEKSFEAYVKVEDMATGDKNTFYIVDHINF